MKTKRTATKIPTKSPRRIPTRAAAEGAEHPVPPSPTTPQAAAIPQNHSWIGDLFAVGHQPAVELSAAQRQLFQSFQSNLVSLLSHELRTPLMSIINALSAIDEQGRPLGGMSLTDALDMARSNTRKLEGALSTVLDLAAWEAGSLQVTLGETSLVDCLEESRLSHLVPASRATQPTIPPRERILGDPAKLARAFSRFEDFISTCGANLELRLDARQIELEFELNTQALREGDWHGLWHEVLVARESGGSLPLHVFAGVLQSERAFLSRSREGLGAELHLIAEILRQHEANFSATLVPAAGQTSPARLRFEIEFPPIEGRIRILKLLRSRIWKPGATKPEPMLLRAHSREPAEPTRRISYALDARTGPWVELADASTVPLGGPSASGASGRGTGGVVQLRCPEDGHDPEMLLSRLLSALPQTERP